VTRQSTAPRCFRKNENDGRQPKLFQNWAGVRCLNYFLSVFLNAAATSHSYIARQGLGA
jgi:hypothetical protein